MVIDSSIDRRGLYLELRSSQNKMLYAFPRVVIDPEELLIVLVVESHDVLVLTSRGKAAGSLPTRWRSSLDSATYLRRRNDVEVLGVGIGHSIRIRTLRRYRSPTVFLVVERVQQVRS